MIILPKEPTPQSLPLDPALQMKHSKTMPKNLPPHFLLTPQVFKSLSLQF